MEFYARESPLEQGVYRFNSQRDGILLKIFNDSISARPFQFPTGWNSTPRLGFLVGSYYSFNSQRDGILLDSAAFKSSIVLAFQFPTGWNSTRVCKTCADGKDGFNSQRDGILLVPPRQRKASKDVSIPNGMEFYLCSAKSNR